MSKFIIAAIIAIMSVSAHAESDPIGDVAKMKIYEMQIEELEAKVAQRDLTIKELREFNLDLLVEML